MVLVGGRSEPAGVQAGRAAPGQWSADAKRAVVGENAGGAESMPRPVRSWTGELVRRSGAAVTQRGRGGKDDSARDNSDLIHGILLGVRAPRDAAALQTKPESRLKARTDSPDPAGTA